MFLFNFYSIYNLVFTYIHTQHTYQVDYRWIIIEIIIKQIG